MRTLKRDKERMRRRTNGCTSHTEVMKNDDGDQRAGSLTGEDEPVTAKVVGIVGI